MEDTKLIESISMPLEAFDLEGFLFAYRRFYRDWSGDDRAEFSVSVLRRHGDTPETLYEDRDLNDELLYRRWLLFFPMHEPPAADSILCIDGIRRGQEELDIGVADNYGFLLEVQDDEISLHPALYDGLSGTIPTLNLQGRCSVLDRPMEEFAQKFVLKE